MKGFKRVACAVLCLAAIVPAAALAGCGGDPDGDTAETKVVRVWLHKSEAEDEGKVYSAIADEFNEQMFQTDDGRNIRMRLEFYNDASTLTNAINSEVVTGGLPDIVAVDAPNIAAYADAEILTDISQYFTSDILSDYVDSVIEQGTFGGGLYALSAMDAPTGLYYNKALLKEIGYTDADFGTVENPWTWDDVMTAMQALKAANKAYKIKLNLGFGGAEGSIYLYSPLVYSAGGSFFGSDGKVTGHLNSDATINGIKVLERFYATTGSDTWAYNGSNEAALAQGEVAFEVHGPWNISTIKKEYSSFVDSYDIMPMPAFNSSSKAYAGCGSWCFGVTPYAKDTKAAAKAVEYLTSAYSSELLYQSIGTFPTHKSSFEAIDDFQTGAAASLAEILTELSKPRPVIVNYPKISDGFSQLLEYIETMYGTSDYNLKSYATSLCVNIDA